MRRRVNKLDSHTRFALGAPADVDDLALLLGLVAHIGQEQALAPRNAADKRKQTTVLIRVEGFRLLVKRLLFVVRAVNQQNRIVRMAQSLATLRLFCRKRAFISNGLTLPLFDFRPILRRGDASAVLFSLSERLPDAAHRDLRGPVTRKQ